MVENKTGRELHKNCTGKHQIIQFTEVSQKGL